MLKVEFLLLIPECLDLSLEHHSLEDMRWTLAKKIVIQGQEDR